VSVLLDAGPSLNFLAVGQQNILVQIAASHNLTMAAPERVDIEVRGKAKDARFARTGVLSTWQKLTASRRIEILDDTLESQPFIDAVSRVSGVPAADRVRTGASLGEIMVIAHASVLAQQNQDVFVLLDDRDARRRAKDERDWLAKRAPGQLTLWSTPQVLRAAAGQQGWIVNGLTWDAVYNQMRKFDDGLPPL
jgi:hypothetical protein